MTEDIKNEIRAGDAITGNLRIGCLETTMALKMPGIINRFTDD
jgi:hypothetical protein